MGIKVETLRFLASQFEVGTEVRDLISGAILNAKTSLLSESVEQSLSRAIVQDFRSRVGILGELWKASYLKPGESLSQASDSIALEIRNFSMFIGEVKKKGLESAIACFLSDDKKEQQWVLAVKENTSLEDAVKAAIKNALTHKLEFQKRSPLIHFALEARDGSWWANGTNFLDLFQAFREGADRKGRYQTLVSSIEKNRDLQGGFVVSEDLGKNRHYLHWYERAKNNAGLILGRAIEFNGSEKELRSFVAHLSGQVPAETDFSRPALFNDGMMPSNFDIIAAADRALSNSNGDKDTQRYLNKLQNSLEFESAALSLETSLEELVLKRCLEEAHSSEDVKKWLRALPSRLEAILENVFREAGLPDYFDSPQEALSAEDTEPQASQKFLADSILVSRVVAQWEHSAGVEVITQTVDNAHSNSVDWKSQIALTNQAVKELLLDDQVWWIGTQQAGLVGAPMQSLEIELVSAHGVISEGSLANLWVLYAQSHGLSWEESWVSKELLGMLMRPALPLLVGKSENGDVRHEKFPSTADSVIDSVLTDVKHPAALENLPGETLLNKLSGVDREFDLVLEGDKDIAGNRSDDYRLIETKADLPIVKTYAKLRLEDSLLLEMGADKVNLGSRFSMTGNKIDSFGDSNYAQTLSAEPKIQGFFVENDISEGIEHKPFLAQHQAKLWAAARSLREARNLDLIETVDARIPQAVFRTTPLQELSLKDGASIQLDQPPKIDASIDITSPEKADRNSSVKLAKLRENHHTDYKISPQSMNDEEHLSVAAESKAQRQVRSDIFLSETHLSAHTVIKLKSMGLIEDLVLSEDRPGRVDTSFNARMLESHKSLRRKRQAILLALSKQVERDNLQVFTLMQRLSRQVSGRYMLEVLILELLDELQLDSATRAEVLAELNFSKLESSNLQELRARIKLEANKADEPASSTAPMTNASQYEERQ